MYYLFILYIQVFFYYHQGTTTYLYAIAIACVNLSYKFSSLFINCLKEKGISN